MSFVYVIRGQGRHIKIGSATNIKSRMASLGSGSPVPLKLFFSVKCKDRAEAFEIEKKARHKLKPLRISGEWFAVEHHQAAYVVDLYHQKAAVDHLDLIVESERLFNLGGKENIRRWREITVELRAAGKYGTYGRRLGDVLYPQA